MKTTEKSAIGMVVIVVDNHVLLIAPIKQGALLKTKTEKCLVLASLSVALSMVFNVKIPQLAAIFVGNMALV